MRDTSKDQYWAAVPSNEIADNVLEQVDKYYEFLSITGRLDLYRRSWAYYYRSRMTGARLNAVGEQGELTSMNVNDYRNLLLHLETMTTENRLGYDCKSVNTDVKSQSQTILGNSLLEYYTYTQKLERKYVSCVKEGLMGGEGFVALDWSPTAGKEYGETETGAPVYEGDVVYSNYSILNCIRDFTQNSADEAQDWFILRKFENKFTLAAEYPDLRDKILNDSPEIAYMIKTTTIGGYAPGETDNIPVYYLRHARTKALPNGRYVKCLDNRTVLLDGPLPYSKPHVYRLAPDEESGTIFGYTVGFDLLPVQEAMDILVSTAITNQSTFGVQNVLYPKGGDFGTSSMSGGLNFVPYDPKYGKPEPLQLTSTPAEVFNFLQSLQRMAETLSGVNSVARGNPESFLKSGTALAFVQSMAIQFSKNLERSYVNLVQDVGLATLELLQEYAQTPRIIQIAGKSNRPLKQYIGSDLDGITRVIVDVGNPLTRTVAGRVNLADALMAQGLIENPDQYIQVLNTGRIEPLVQSKQSEALLIKSENEGLSDGMRQIAVVTDAHAQHILEHRVVLASPEARQDPVLMQNTLDHIQEHINMLKMTDPVLLQLIHQQSFAQAPQAPGGAPGGMLQAGAPAEAKAAQIQPPAPPQPPQGSDPESAAIIEAEGQQVA